MDAHLFRRFSDAAVPLLTGARFVKLQEPADGVLTVNFDLWNRHSSWGKKVQLVFRPGRKDAFCFLSSVRMAAGSSPSARIMRLRKYLVGHHVRSIVVDWTSRVFWMLVSGDRRAGGEAGDAEADRVVWLRLSLREGAELVWLSPEEIPEAAAPVWPDSSRLEGAMENWRDWPVLSPPLRRTLKGLPEGERRALLADLEEGGGDIFLYSRKGSPGAKGSRCIVQASAWPLSPEQIGDLEESVSEDILLGLMQAGGDIVLAQAQESAARRAAQPLMRRRKKLQALIDRQDEEEARLRNMAEARERAELLRAWLWQWPRDLKQTEVAVPDAEGGDTRIALDCRYTVRENMERMFHRAKRGERGLGFVVERRRELGHEMEKLEEALRETLLTGTAPVQPKPSGKKAELGVPPSSRVQVFVSSDGITLLRGRDARGNEAVRRMSSPHDIWVHAEGGPGSHVIIRRSHAAEVVPDRTLDEAGGLAACRSWLRDEPRARLTYCELRHVKPLRGAAPGTMRMDKVLFTREVPVDAGLEERLVPSGQEDREPRAD